MADLDFGRMATYNAEGDKNTTLQIGVYMGHPSINVWSNRSQVVRIPTPRSFLVLMKQLLRKAISGKPGDKNSVSFTKWDQETKKSTQLGVLYVGRDDKAVIYIGLQVQGHPPTKFPIKAPISFETGEPMSDHQRSELGAETLIEQLTHDIPTAMALTNFKRTDMPNRSGGGGHHVSSSNENSASIF